MNSSAISSQDFRHCRFYKRFRIIYKSETFMSMFNGTGWTRQGVDGFVFRRKRSRNTRENSRKETGCSTVWEFIRSWVPLCGLFTFAPINTTPEPLQQFLAEQPLDPLI